jgi:hypothetical protein
MKKLLLPLLIYMSGQMIGCGNKDGESEELARNSCATCHQFPDPTLLPKSQWEKQVLPLMAHYMGLYESDFQRDSLVSLPQYNSLKNKQAIFPASPMITTKEWKKIMNYYLSHAPEDWKTPTMNVTRQNSDFKVLEPLTRFKSPSTTMVKFGNKGNLMIGDVNTSRYYELRNDFSIARSGELEEGPVWADHVDEETYILLMGSFTPDDAGRGMLVSVPDNQTRPPKVEIDGLKRPADAVREDFNGDGLADFAICEFGRVEGGLNVYLATKNSGYSKKELWKKPGAVSVKVLDLNNDGLMDIVALFAQADEGIDVYFNHGEGNFTRQRLISFPPSFGSSSFHMVDFDLDGDMDLLYTAGDNADFIPILKPYHGVYLFENNGNGNFKQRRFLYMPGAYKALMHDFDLDGDLDIAAISYFPDFSISEPMSFALFINQGNLNFIAESIDLQSLGRWIVMDAADKDNDGDVDIALGSLLMEPNPKGNWIDLWLKKSVPFIVLENTHRKPVF